MVPQLHGGFFETGFRVGQTVVTLGETDAAVASNALKYFVKHAEWVTNGTKEACRESDCIADRLVAQCADERLTSRGCT